MDLGLRDKTVLITGGSKGIGKAIAQAFMEEGALVAITARGIETLEMAKQELGDVRIYPCDITDAEQREQMLAAFLADNGQIDVLINNAGGSNGGHVLDTDLALFEQAMQLNFFSAVHLSQLAAQRMKNHGSGAIINISSIYGREAGGRVTYNNSKSALISFTKAFANEVIRYGIRVNGIAPGSILHPTGNWQKRLEEKPTEIHQFIEQNIPAGRFGKVEEVAHVAVFLASHRASWIVGATINVDGGQSKSNF